MHGRLLEVLDPLANPLLGVPAAAVSPLEIHLVGLEIARGLSTYPRPLIGRKLRLEGGGDVQRHVGLDREDIGELTVIRLRPEVLIRPRIDELGDDPHSISDAPYAPLEHRRHRELRRDLPKALLPLLERHHRGTRDHVEGAHLRELGDDVLGDSVGEVLVLRVRAEVEERQHGNGPWHGVRWGGRRERLHERPRRRESVSRVSGERLHERVLDGGRDRGPQAADGGHRVGQALGDNGLCRRTRVRRLAGEGLVQQAAEAVHVAAPIDLALARGLLRTHVLGRPHHQPGLGQPHIRRGAYRQRDPEVRDDGFAFVEQDVLRLDVTVDHLPLVRVIERGGDLPGDAQRLVDAKLLLASELAAQRFAPDVGHDVEEEPAGLTGVVQRQDVGMIQPGRGGHLSQKPVGPEGERQLGPQHLDRHLALVFHIVGEIHRRHAPAAELSLDGVTARERRAEAPELIASHPIG